MKVSPNRPPALVAGIFLQREKGQWLVAHRYLAALLAPAIVAAVMQLTWPFLQTNPVQPFLLAVIFCAWYGGLGPGLLSLGLSLMITDFFFMEPYFAFWLPTNVDLVRLGLFGIIGIVISVISEATHRSQWRAAANLQSVTSSEATMKQSEDHLRRVLNNLFAFVAVLLPDGTLIEANRSPLEAAGISFTDVQGKKVWDCYWLNYDPEVQARVRAACERAARGETSRFDLVVRMAGGALMPIDFMLAPMRNDAGEITHLIPSAIDITERKRAEDALTESETRLRAILDAEPECVKLLAADGSLLDMNPAGLAMIEADSLAQVQGASVCDLALPEHRKNFMEANRRVFAGESALLEFEIAGIKGTRRWLEMHATPLRDRNQTIIAALGITRDVSERRLAEQALREKEHLLSESQRIAHVGSWLYDPTGVSVWSEEMYRIYGVSPDTFVPTAESFLNLIHPDDRARMQAWAAQCLAGESPGEFEYRATLPDGTVRFISAHAELQYTAEGRPAYLTGTAQDITARKQAEAALRASEGRLRELLEDVELIAVQLDVEGRVTFCNDFLLRLTGYAADEVVGVEWFQKFIPTRYEDVKQSFVDTLRTGGVAKHFENPIRTKAGDLRTVAWNNTVLRDTEGNIVGTASIGEDITERKQAEAALRESEENYRTLVESASDGIMVSDAEGRLLDVNAAACRMFGYARAELLTMRNTEIITPDEVPRMSPGMPRLNGGEVVRSEWKCRRKDGTVFPCEVSGTVLPSGRVLAILRDITERKRAEETLRAKNEELAGMTQQLWQASKLATMGELSASIAHELNNPLTTVTLSVETLMSQLAGDDNKVSLLNTVRSESERMADLVSNLLLFSRRSHAQISTLNIADDVTRSLDLIGAHLKGRSVRLVRETSLDLPTVQGDRQQLLQVFLNLLTNATDAMPEGGTLSVRIRPDSLNDQPAVLLEFADTGIGIEAEHLEAIWEPFVTTKPEGKGTGLGLPICRRTVEEHGGAIAINSKVGLGTTVTIRLPVTTALLA